jgi:hypothetical protein
VRLGQVEEVVNDVIKTCEENRLGAVKNRLVDFLVGWMQRAQLKQTTSYTLARLVYRGVQLFLNGARLCANSTAGGKELKKIPKQCKAGVSDTAHRV